MRMRMLLAVTLAAIVFAGACAKAGSGGGSGSPSGPGTILYPTGADRLVLRIDQGGGFINPQVTISQIPLISLFGDGLLITPGAQAEIYPGPALPTVVQERLTPDAIQRVLIAARDAGLFESRHLSGVPDTGTTTFTVVANGQTTVTTMGGLGMSASGSSDDQARQELQAFEAKVMDLGWLPPGSISDQGTYRPTALRVYVSEYQPSQGLHETPVAWPLDPPLATFGDPVAQGGLMGTRCGAVTGSDLGTLLPLAEKANELTPWTSGGARYALRFRPLLPDESGC